MVSHGPFRSRARNGEDVILWRALAEVTDGRFVDVGASGPATGSITAALAEQGWKGIEVPVAAVLDRPFDEVLASQGMQAEKIHVLAVDAGGQESTVLARMDLGRIRPAVLLVSAVPAATGAHPGWEQDVLAAGYRFCLFTGLFRIYVSAEHDDVLGGTLSYPPCVLDDVLATSTPDRLAQAEDEALRWRALALARWDEAANGSTLTSAAWEVALLRDEVAAMKRTVSWRITRPIRVARRRLSGPTARRWVQALRGGR